MKPALHGGDLGQAIRQAKAFGFDGGEVEDWLDLSTGINPRPYPVSDLPPTLWHTLPGHDDKSHLLGAACQYYGAPSPTYLLAAAGSAQLIASLPQLFDPTPVSIVCPTYEDHYKAWSAADFPCQEIKKPLEGDTPLLIITNPNNPDGTSFSHDEMALIAEKQTRQGGWLIVDEAFCDMVPDRSCARLVDHLNVIIFKSFGKFFGLAGLRLGFMIAPEDMIAKMRTKLGSWPVSGPAIHIANKALIHDSWHQETRTFLRRQAEATTRLLSEAHVKILGGTDLFTLIESDHAPTLFRHLLEAKIYCRRFHSHPNWLRIGLPGDAKALNRLRQGLGCL